MTAREWNKLELECPWGALTNKNTPSITYILCYVTVKYVTTALLNIGYQIVLKTSVTEICTRMSYVFLAGNVVYRCLLFQCCKYVADAWGGERGGGWGRTLEHLRGFPRFKFVSVWIFILLEQIVEVLNKKDLVPNCLHSNYIWIEPNNSCLYLYGIFHMQCYEISWDWLTKSNWFYRMSK